MTYSCHERHEGLPGATIPDPGPPTLNTGRPWSCSHVPRDTRWPAIYGARGRGRGRHPNTWHSLLAESMPCKRLMLGKGLICVALQAADATAHRAMALAEA